MGKKRSKCIAEEGILHLKDCFVSPSVESGLLNTVGGEWGLGLNLSPNYGYGVPDTMSEQEANEHPDECVTQESTPNPLYGKRQRIDSNVMQGNLAQDLHMVKMARSIAGGIEKPFEPQEPFQDEVVANHTVVSKVSMDKETTEFYANVGMTSKKTAEASCVENNESKKSLNANGNGDMKAMKCNGTDASISDITIELDPPEPMNNLESITAYYKDYCKYYHSSSVSDSYGSDPLQFGPPIDSSSEVGIDKSLIELAQAAQKARISFLNKRKEDELLKKRKEYQEAYDPLPTEIIATDTAQRLGVSGETTVKDYWKFVKKDPYDFQRWALLLTATEHSGNLTECRKCYGCFLPLFPYCYGYWQRYSSLEKSHRYFQRSLKILVKSLEFNPLCFELWKSYIDLFIEISFEDPDAETHIRSQYEKAIASVGKDFRSDGLWDAFIRWEISNKKLLRAFDLYKQLICIPTRLYNRHYENARAFVRDYHPRDFLHKSEYEALRWKGCERLGYKYFEEPEIEVGEIIFPSKPEDRLMTYVKEQILVQLESSHKNCEEEVSTRWDFEDKIRRPYFHEKELDKNQLNNWDEYINFELSKGDHDRIAMVFERCVTSCARYEYFWAKYARYLENYYRTDQSGMKKISSYIQKAQGITEVISSNIGSDEKMKEDAQAALDGIIDQIVASEKSGDSLSNEGEKSESKSPALTGQTKFITSGNKSSQGPVKAGKCSNFSSISQKGKKTYEPPRRCQIATDWYSRLLRIEKFPDTTHEWQERVRGVYQRACIIHCPRKPAIKLQWAAFEEELGNPQQAKKLISQVLRLYPKHLDAKLQMLELKRRTGGDVKGLKNLYEKYLDQSIETPAEFSLLSLKFANYLHKEEGETRQALKILKGATEIDKNNFRLYSTIFQICYDKVPVEKKSVFAALQLALRNKDLTKNERLQFLKKKVVFLQEHGDIHDFRDAIDELIKLQKEVDQEVSLIEEMRKEQEAKDFASKMYDAVQSNVKLHRETVPYSVPFKNSSQSPKPIEFLNDDDEVVEAKKNERKDTHNYKMVPPVSELTDGFKHGCSYLNPHNKTAENEAHKEYQRLESSGVPDHLKDTEEDIKAMRLERKQKRHQEPIYIVPPKNVQYVGSSDNKKALQEVIPGAKVVNILGLNSPTPVSMLAVPRSVPVVNIPEWFLNQGGELCLSETSRGFSILRFFPKFVVEEVRDTLFQAIRRCVKWHQKQAVLGRKWKFLPRLVSWFGPCDYSHSGMTLKKYEDWPPAVIDLLHAINGVTNHAFNSCSLALYRTGHDSNAWHSDCHPALGSNPPIASLSLGTERHFELKRRGKDQNYVRFPLKPGSLLLMEGACQEDWIHQIPKDPSVKDERINLTFRVMHAVELYDPKDSSVLNSSMSLKCSEKQETRAAVNPDSTKTHGEDSYNKLANVILNSGKFGD